MENDPEYHPDSSVNVDFSHFDSPNKLKEIVGINSATYPWCNFDSDQKLVDSSVGINTYITFTNYG